MVEQINHCEQEAEIASLQERVHNLEENHKNFNMEIQELRKVQIELTKSITELNSTVKGFKWTVMAVIGVFGGVLTFLVQELIKII